MEPIVPRNKKGYSLIEVLFAIVILAIVSLAIMQISIVAMRQNLQNSVRDEAVRVSELYMNALRGKALGYVDVTNKIDLATTGGAFVSLPTVSRTFRGGGQVAYQARKNVASMSVGAKESRIVTIEVEWQYRGQNFTHTATSIAGGE